MNFIEKVPDGSPGDSAYSKLALLAVCAIFITAAIDRQLAAQERAHQADCVHCSDHAAATSVGGSQGTSLAADAKVHA
ncbi:MAG TPA: hypothetical protein VNW26_05370 [Steroidobacteraceae bacterium]|nr:hypothetical protein [Steroidobacteraceae bacterium]